MRYEPERLSADDMLARLHDVDDFMTTDGYKGRMLVMMVVGGSALVLQGETDRLVSRDIDVIDADPILLPYIMRTRDINTDARAYADCLPYNYEDRVRQIEERFDNFVVITPSLEDLVVMKLFASRGSDEADLRSDSLLKNLDWKLLDELVLGENEAKASVLADANYRSLVMSYQGYRAAYGPSSEPLLPWPYSAVGRRLT